MTPTITATPTNTPTPTSTATPTPTGPTPTPTNTFPPRQDFILPQGANEFVCTKNEALHLGFSLFEPRIDDLANPNFEDPENRHTQFLAVYVAPGLNQSDYGYLRQMSAPGGFIDRFVELGGVAVINVAGQAFEQPEIAPRGVGYVNFSAHNEAAIQQPSHPYLLGDGFGGEPLTTASFAAWAPTDRGHLTNIPPDATVVLRNFDGPSWIEYNHGAGRVIVTTLTYCTEDQPASIGAPLDNLLKYSRFFSGGAQTPAPTVTPTGTATATPTGATSTPTPTRTATPTITPSPTPTHTVTITPTTTATRTVTATTSPTLSPTETPSHPTCVGDCNGNGSVTVDELVLGVNIALGSESIETCPAFDTDESGSVTVDELVRGVTNALTECPAS